MKVYTVKDIEALGPCKEHSPNKYVTADWTGTVVDILQCTQVDPVNRLWVAYRILDDKTLRLFAVACARRALSVVNNPDPRSIEACNVAEKFANGEVTEVELTTAWYAAVDAAEDAENAAGAATYAARAARNATYVARNATYAARDADAAAADAAAAAAAAADADARAAVDADADAAAARAAVDAARGAARGTERQNQIDWFINYLRG